MQRKLRERRTCSCVFFSNGYRTAEEVDFSCTSRKLPFYAE
nr:unnamed protein product [Callosobruchus chinensis]